jgi:hypothetical protein
MKPLNFRSDYAHSCEGLSELSRLIYDVFEVDVSPLDRMGASSAGIGSSPCSDGKGGSDCLRARVDPD